MNQIPQNITVGLFLLLCLNVSYAMYDPQAGRFMQRDPLGIDPAGGTINPFKPKKQYADGLNIYEYAKSQPAISLDSYGLSECSAGCEFNIHFDGVKTEPQEGYYGKVISTKWIFESKTVPCKGSMLKIVMDDCQAGVSWWYVDPQIYSRTDRFGRNTREHEWEHVQQRQMAWEGLLAEAGKYIGKCYCPRKAECYNRALWSLQNAYNWFGEMITHGYDCESYTDGMDPAERKRACDQSELAERFFDDNWSTYEDAIKVCEKYF